MADEISQVVEMEYRGVYYLFKGSKAFIAEIARMIKALHDWGNEKYLKKPGNCTWAKLQEISNGTPPILEFPKEMFERHVIGKDEEGELIYSKSDFDLYCEKYKLRYCIMPDLNENDDYIPVAVPAQDMGIHQEQIKSVMSRRIQREEAKDSSYDEQIRDAEERLANAKNDSQKAEAEAELTMLKDAKVQNEKLLNESKEKANRDNVLDFAEYLKQGEGTLSEFDPEMALKQANSCGVVKEYEPYDCMWPVRDADLVPESKEIYYSQRTSDDQIHYIRRKFVEDEQGRLYSEYYVRIPGTTKDKVYSDFGFSQAEWEKKLPELLKEAGLQNEIPTAVVRSEARFYKYKEFIEENFKSAQDKNLGESTDLSYSSEKAKDFVEEYNENVKVTKNYEDSQFTKITVDTDRLMYDESGVLCLQLDEGLLKGVMVDSMNEQATQLFINGDNTYSIVKPDGKSMAMSGESIIAGEAKDAIDFAQKAMARKGR